jgi:hypothetical protein
MLSMALLEGCRSRPRMRVPANRAMVGRSVPAPAAPATQVPRNAGDLGARIRGRIIDELGPPPAATVYVLRRKREATEEEALVDPLWIVRSDARGEFSFDRTSAASGELRIHIAGLPPRRLWVPGFAPHAPILILGTRTLHGLVHDPEGRTVAEALVQVFVDTVKRTRGHEGTGHQISARTRSDGSYCFDRLPAGRCRLTVEGLTPEGESWLEERWSFTGPKRITRVDLGSRDRLPVVTARVLAEPGGEPQGITLLGFRPASGRVRWAGQGADGTWNVRLPPGAYEAVMSVAVEIDDGVFGEGEAALRDAAGNPATITIRRDAPDPAFDFYLPAK